jgi:translation initiation factor IF-1
MVKNNKVITIKGQIEEALPGLQFRVSLENQDRLILAHLAGKMKMYRIKVVPGDTVLVEVPNEKSERGRIIRRL